MTGSVSRGTSVTVGVPVRNGGPTLRRALESVVRQTYDDLTIIVSDNCSTDNTGDIAAEFMARDARIRYVRHEQPLTVLENFRFLVDQARSEYFLWAAHDDYRTTNYVEVLAEKLKATPEAVLAFTDIILFSDEDHDLDNVPPVGQGLDWGSSYEDRVRRVISNKCSVLYGLFRTEALREYPWIQCDFGVDIPLLLYMRSRGEFVYTPGARFYEWIVPGGVVPRSQRARNEGLRDYRRWPLLRLSWACGSALAHADRLEGRRPRQLTGFLVSLTALKRDSVKLWTFQRLPDPVKRLWHRYKRRQFAV